MAQTSGVFKELELLENNILTFELRSVLQHDPPTMNDNAGFVIAFVPTEGFQWCSYANRGTWFSIVKKDFVKPTHWLKQLNK